MKLKIGEIYYSEEYGYVGKLIDISGSQAELMYIDTDKDTDTFYCESSKCRVATKEDIDAFLTFIEEEKKTEFTTK